MQKEVRNFEVHYSHDDGRSGTVIVTTEVGKSQAFQYGNGKYGVIKVGDFEQLYDLRYCREKDLHMTMLEDYFGDGLCTVEEF